MRVSLALIFALLTQPAFAVGSDDDTPPTPTETTTQCEGDQIYDEETKTCVSADSQTLNDTQRYKAVRELAYASDFERARLVIASAETVDDPRFLNYQGFIMRKTGDMDAALAFYERALEIDPDYHLARSYMGQGLYAAGDIVGAEEQLREIAARGGRHGWPHRALSMTLSNVKGGTY